MERPWQPTRPRVPRSTFACGVSRSWPAWHAADVTSDRLRRRIEQDFSDASQVYALLDSIGTVAQSERVQAAAVLWSHGDLDRLTDACQLAQQDWRDVLVRAALDGEDWATKLDAELGPD